MNSQNLDFRGLTTMKPTLIPSLSIAAATATAVFSLGAAAQAATFLGLDATPTPGTAIQNTTGDVPYKASTFTGDGKTYEFSVLTPTGLGSRGMATSDFGFFVNGSFTSLFSESQKANGGSNNANDWLGTCTADSNGNVTIKPCTIDFTFAQGSTYQLALKNNGKVSTGFGVYQKDSYTFNLKSDEQPNMTTMTVSEAGAYFIGAEDGMYNSPNGGKYSDFQDWVVKVKAVPESSTVGAVLGLGVVGLMSLRRKGIKG
ncbi:PEP-CTERM sorting domain-containing protein [Limnofasciculus baicalensis]|uniref:PEP-CTERM sorting domain-containing protein n=1 Tax=Limnofasciculus baicalensis BBK-W-15 TaxID=2699891 RepID=A0AAE3GQW0_9CYAN|nr:PEP-CTERM sorting domain-containing protein [Limnofasciculus baicalensis]MCP2728412.1 PEP-CTERM sorting domain-containing protein [Limnofasciculus baicalensis BBK-W-15]